MRNPEKILVPILLAGTLILGIYAAWLATMKTLNYLPPGVKAEAPARKPAERRPCYDLKDHARDVTLYITSVSTTASPLSLDPCTD